MTSSEPGARLPRRTVRRRGEWAVGNNGDVDFAVSRRCRHQFADLSDGRIGNDGCLICPWHGSRYDVQSGEMVAGPRGFLFWHGPTNSADPASNASVTFNGTPITGTNIGTASDNNWGFQNSQSYRADVTSLVSGNGTYNLTNFLKADADINGVSLIVFYNDSDPSNDRNVVAWNGNDSNIAFGSDPANWDETISGVPYPGSGAASLDLVVSDGQSYNDADVVVNGTTVAAAGAIFQGDSGPNYAGNPGGVTGSLWDVKSFNITSLLTSGGNNLHLTSGTAGDALSLVVAIANVPASAPVIG